MFSLFFLYSWSFRFRSHHYFYFCKKGFIMYQQLIQVLSEIVFLSFRLNSFKNLIKIDTKFRFYFKGLKPFLVCISEKDNKTTIFLNFKLHFNLYFSFIHLKIGWKHLLNLLLINGYLSINKFILNETEYIFR